MVKVVAGVLKETREIFLFDSPPDHDTTLFVGEPSKPLPIPCMSLLHEIGHAIADYARIRAPNQHDSPLVLAAFGAVRGSERGPTPYGRSDLSESFAESFAMAKADPGSERNPTRVVEYVLRFALGASSPHTRAPLLEFVDQAGGRISPEVVTGLLLLVSAMPEYQLC